MGCVVTLLAMMVCHSVVVVIFVVVVVMVVAMMVCHSAVVVMVIFVVVVVMVVVVGVSVHNKLIVRKTASVFIQSVPNGALKQILLQNAIQSSAN